MSNSVVKEPRIHVVKRTDVMPLQTVKVAVISIVLAALACAGFLMLVTDFKFTDIFATMFSASFSSSNRFIAFAQDACLLLLIAVGLAPCFKMRFWNIGAQGQLLMGGLIAAILMYYVRDGISSGMMILLCLLGALLIAGVWCLIPAIFKVRFGSNETLFTLMMNYIAIQLVFCFTHIWKGPKSSFGVIDRFTGSKNGYLPAVFGIDVGWTLLLSLFLTVIMYVYLNKTKHGYEITVVGESVNTARYAGINDKKVMLRTAFLSGAICGLSGFLYVTNVSHTISNTTGGSFGFTAIIVAWLGEFNPIVMTLISVLLIFLNKGAGDIRNIASLDNSICDVVVCIFLFFILGSGFFSRYKLVFNKKNK